MPRRILVSSIVAVALLAATAGAPVDATTHDKLTYLTFSGPVQIPGATLDAGTYRFHLANPSTSRNVVQVLSHDGQIVYAMLHTIPDYRANVTSDSIVTFREAPVGVAPPVKSLFYGGERRGYEFLYGRGEPNMVPPITIQPAITFTPIVTAEPVTEYAGAAAIEAAPIVAEPFVEPAPAPALPATASPLPLVAFGGLASLVLGLGLGWLRRHVV